MSTIIDDTIDILASFGLKSVKVTTPPGFAGIQVNLPHDSQAFFIWNKIDANDYHFRVARFWANDNPFSMWASPNLIDAIAQARVFVNQ